MVVIEGPPAGIRFSLCTIAACAALLAAMPEPAGAHAGPHPGAIATGSTDVPAAVHAVAGGETVEVGDGLYAVDPEVGAPVLTHGPDTRAATGARSSPLAPDGTGFVTGAVERPPACATDFYQRVVYAHVSGAPDRLADTAAEIRSVVGRMNAVLNAEAIASGGQGADYKVLCDGAGAVRIDQLTVSEPSFEAVVSAARAAGLASDRSDALVFVDAAVGGSCGIASYEQDEALSIDNRSNAGGGFALVYEPCWEGETAMHESAHMMGAVQYSAPNSTGTGGHCNERADVLCYAPDGGDRNQAGMVDRCPGTPRFDCGFDDYFDAAPEPGEYLDSHWNVGSSLNRFIAFADPAPPAPSPAQERLRRGRKRGASGERGDWRRFRVRVPTGATVLRVRLFAGPGADLALFARRHGAPTRDVYACRALLRDRHAACRIDEPAAGRWQVGVLTRGGAVGVGFTISARAR